MRMLWIVASAAYLLGDTFGQSTGDTSPDPICTVYGIDFQQDGTYFINIASTSNFTVVSQFENCSNSTADVLLVNDDNLDEYYCAMIPTSPDDVSQLSSCPVRQGALTSGNYSILTIGNDGEGDPFAYQRHFSLAVGQQTIVTETSTADWTVIQQPTSTVKVTSTVLQTSTQTNDVTITSNTMGTLTVTPAPYIVPKTDMLTRTFFSWTTTRFVETKVATPSCTVPPRPSMADDWLRFAPTGIPLPPGLQFQWPINRNDGRAVDVGTTEHMKARDVQKRAPDAQTITTTTTVGGSKTTTIQARTTTITDVEATTMLAVVTLPPQTIYITEVDTVTAPRPTETLDELVYQREYITKTMSITWTSTSTSTPAAAATACRAAGGSFGYVYGG